MKDFLIYPLLLLVTFGLSQRSNTYTVRTIAFYNVENLFDTQNDSLVFDDDRTPEGKDRWSKERYLKKLEQIARVIAGIGADITQKAPDLIGLCEVENKLVLQHLIDQPVLLNKDYGIVHFDSPDERGIDVALLYKRAVFIPDSFVSRRLLLFDLKNERDYTRDQLVVGGYLDNEKIYVIVNHWPSRSGGERRSKPYRISAAQLNKRIVDSLLRVNPDAKIISMGDLNDNPNDDSLKKALGTQGNSKHMESGVLFNPMEKLYKRGIGSLAYRDKWHLFDQILISLNLVDPTAESYRFWKVGIYNPPDLITPKGHFKGYPFRTYAGGNYLGGYSDHFPVYIHLIKAHSRLFEEKRP